MPDLLDRRSLGAANPEAERPAYRPCDHGIGIVHLGLGAFHRAHQAVYTDTALARAGGDWRIAGVSMRSSETADALSKQDGLYTLLVRGASATRPRLIASLGEALSLGRDRDRVVSRLASANTRIVSLTVTEKAYFFDAQRQSLDFEDPEVKADLEAPERPRTVPGLLVQAMRARRGVGTKGLSVLCCDNLPDNGRVARRVVLDFAERTDSGLADWISNNVAFPSTMVDRITPRLIPADIDEANALTGLRDAVPVGCEAFSQWIIEDSFAHGRPAWEEAGAVFVDDVTPYEKMKLRMLNGSHSLLAYVGHAAGLATIGECVGNAVLGRLLPAHLRMVSDGLPLLAGVDYADYASQLVKRFGNPGISHETYQIAMDGSQKMPQRIFEPAMEALERDMPVDSFVFATAAWMRYLLGVTEENSRYDLRDPKGPSISRAIAGQTDARSIIEALGSVEGLLPGRLFSHRMFVDAVAQTLDEILADGVLPTAKRVADGLRH